jgi:hypothetical protein
MEITADTLREALNWADIDGSVRSYSGRAMYGRDCAAIVIESPAHLCAFFVGLTTVASEQDLGISDEDVLDLACQTRTDSMGLSVVAYWPSCELIGDEDDDD